MREGRSVEVLHVLLHGGVSNRVPARRSRISATRPQTQPRAEARGAHRGRVPVVGEGFRRELKSVSPRLLAAILVIAAALPGAVAQTPAPEIQRHVDSLFSFDYPTRMNAARMLRRAAPAAVVPAL